MFARFVQHCAVETRADIAIVGGGIMGSALAFWLTRLESTVSVVVIGSSGHGMQQGPIVGRGMAELLLKGGFTSLDLRPLGYERLRADLPLRELNVIG